GRDPLGAGTATDSHAYGFGVTAPVPHQPLILAVNVSGGRSTMPAPVRAVPPASAEDANAVSSQRTRTSTIDVSYAPRSRVRARASYRDVGSDGTNVGVGGLVRPEAGSASALRSHDVHATMSIHSARFD